MCFDQLYTMDEVSIRNGKHGEKIWIIIKNSVYDLTEFIDKHPAGSDLILEWGGKDATNAFRDVGHSMDANQMLKTYKIGELAIREETSRSDSIVTATISNSKTETKIPKQKKRIKMFFCV